jgi:3-(3-hydroxy-phenyl)propionate hydroxylase
MKPSKLNRGFIPTAPSTARNKQLMEQRDPEARRRAQEELCRMAANPASAKQFLMKSSMIEALRAAARLERAAA